MILNMILSILKQLLLMSRYAFYGLIIQCTTLNVLWAESGKAQQKSVSEIYVTINWNSTTLTDAIGELEQQTDLFFTFSSEVAKSSIVTLKKKNKSLKIILEDLSKSLRVGFKRVNENIHISKLNGQTPIKELIDSIDQTISGTVTDENGNRLPGASVIAKGTTVGTITDINGSYNLSVDDDVQTLVFSYIGYLQEEVTINGRSVIDISMTADVSQLEEVVVIGYGTQKKASLTSAVVSVEAEDIRSIPTSQLSNSLAGRLPGVQIIGNSGLVGANSSINIRGTGTEPLYVIDNIISDKSQFDVLDPNEVETITVLKDAAAAAIYGARASGGVVVVTTRTGTPGKVVFNYSNVFTTNSLTEPLQEYTAEEELTFMNNVATHRNMASPNPDPDFTVPFDNAALAFARNIDYGTVNDEIWQSPSSQQHNLSVGGGLKGLATSFLPALTKPEDHTKTRILIATIYEQRLVLKSLIILLFQLT